MTGWHPTFSSRVGSKHPLLATSPSLPQDVVMRPAPVLALLALTLAGACSPAVAPAPVPPAANPEAPPPPKPAERVRLGYEHLRASRYAEAQAEFAGVTSGAQLGLARLGLAEVELMTGHYADAADTAGAAGVAGAPPEQVAELQARALRLHGKLADAEAVLREVADRENAHAARVLLGELLIEQGRRDEATDPLMRVVSDYNSDVIKNDDGANLALVGRAAYLLRSPEDANEAFNLAEEAAPGHIPTLLWRAELFLGKYDPGHAEEVTQEVLEQAPRHPDALVAMAHVKLAQTYDFDEADRLARRALEVNPKHAGAHFVRAGIALRDMELARADAELDAGLKFNPIQLELLSMKAAVRFLADDMDGFRAARDRILKLNPQYSRLYEIVGEYAEWEHRYDEIVAMMRDAILIDPDDAKARAQLGINLIRAGSDDTGVRELQRAFDRDPFNVRVYNTLNLYEKVIPSEYVSVEHGIFNLRYHRSQQRLLERYVPDLLDEAWGRMVDHYGFTPDTPVGVELYPTREHFAIRTSGLPNTGIQGVCFGRTFASMSPGNETFNLGMTLWHELSHVFHIQLSKSHVPRWFTEGLAEWETLSTQPEWSRELDPDLFEAFRTRRLPEIAQMNRAFTRAEHMSDMATAYYASTKILVMLQKEYGLGKISEMMRQWGKGQRTPAVVRSVLGVTPEQLDDEFKKYVAKELARYQQQFVPIRRTGHIDAARAAAKKAPGDLRAQCVYALALIREDEIEQAKKIVAQVLEKDPKYADAVWLESRLLLTDNKHEEARRLLESLVSGGNDGFEVQMALAELAEARNDLGAMKTALEKAHRFDPSAAETLAALGHLAREIDKPAEEIDALRKYVVLSEHDAGAYQRLLRLLVDAGRTAEAVQVGRAAIYVDMEGILTHRLYAQALAAENQLDRARFELESALLCPGRPGEKAEIHGELAALLQKLGRTAEARQHAMKAKEAAASNAVPGAP